MKDSAYATTIEPLAVSPAEAARIVGISRSSLYQLIDGGEIANFKAGRRRLIPTDALRAWVAARSAAPR
jgi:excisionase family DNA binding protein